MRRHCVAVTVLVIAFAGLTSSTHAQLNRDINSYVLFAYDSLEFQGGNTNAGWGYITGGNVGVNYPVDYPGRPQNLTTFSLKIGTSNYAIMSDGTQASADSVTDGIAHKASIYDLYANSVSASFASTPRNSGPTAWAPTPLINAPTSATNFPFTPGRASTDGGTNITVGTGGSFTFTAGTFYRDVEINDNASVTFGAGVFDIRNVHAGVNVTFNVTDATILQIDRKFDPSDDLKFGLGTSSGAHIYVGAFGLNVTTERATSLSNGGEIHAQYFAPTGWLDIGSEDNMFGRFWAQRISGDPNDNVTFVPEPTTFALVGLGLIGALAIRRRRI